MHVRGSKACFNPECLLSKDYYSGDMIGKGAFGVVQVVIKKSMGKAFACKTISKKKTIVDESDQNEIVIALHENLQELLLLE